MPFATFTYELGGISETNVWTTSTHVDVKKSEKQLSKKKHVAKIV